MKIKISKPIQKIVVQAFNEGDVLKTNDKSTVYEVTGGDLDGCALLLFTAGNDMPANHAILSSNLIMPVEVDGRHGYLVARESAMNFQ